MGVKDHESSLVPRLYFAEEVYIGHGVEEELQLVNHKISLHCSLHVAAGCISTQVSHLFCVYNIMCVKCFNLLSIIIFAYKISNIFIIILHG